VAAAEPASAGLCPIRRFSLRLSPLSFSVISQIILRI
jgi:hypothetical protein